MGSLKQEMDGEKKSELGLRLENISFIYSFQPPWIIWGDMSPCFLKIKTVVTKAGQISKGNVRF